MAAPLARMFPPGDGKHSSIKVNGRTYTAALGSFLDVATFDAHGLAANGWNRAGTNAFVGPTSNRPTSSAGQPIVPGQLFFDTTLQVPVIWDTLGAVWRNIWTGAAA